MRRDPAILLLALGQTMAWATIYYLFPALLLRWEQALGWTKADLTAAITLAVLVSAAASPIAGRIIDKGKGAALVAGASLLAVAGLVGLSFVQVQWQFYLAWGVLGLAMAGCLYDPCFAIVTRSRGGEARRGIIAITLIAGFAGTISYPVVYSLAESLGWRGAVRVMAAVVLLVVLPLLWFGVRMLVEPAPASVNHNTPPVAARSFLKGPVFWFLAAGFAALAIAHGAALHHLLPLLDERGHAPELAVLAASFIGPMQVAGRLAMMASERYLSNHGVALAAYAALGLSLLLLLFSGTSPAFLSLAIILYGGAWGTVSILRPLLAREVLGGDGFGAKSGALAMPFLAGAAVSPFLGSLIWAKGGYDLMLVTLVGVAALGCGLYWIAYRLAHRG